MILEKVKKTILEHHLLQKKDKVLVAYSGGVDSTGLVHLLLELREEWSLELFLAHFNHKLRKAAEEDEKFVRGVARNHSLPIFVGEEDVRTYAREKRLNIEEAGRMLRYLFLEKIALEADAAKIATGHTLTDQAETVLIRFLRGSGLRGLAGIYPAVEEMIIRPLIDVEREEIENYLEERGIKFRIDESNFDRRFLRNRIRLELLPYLRENFEPEIVSRLGRLASILREEESLLEKITQEKKKRAILKNNAQISLDLEFLSSLPRALSRRLAREFVSELRGNLRDISFEDVESLLNLGERKEYSLKKGFILRREQGQLFLKKAASSKKKYEHLWSGKGSLEIQELGMKFKGKKIEKRDCLRLDFDDRSRAFLDLGKLGFPLLVRNRRKGDRYQPLGAPGHKKLKEILRAKGIPLAEREEKPVFLSGGEIVWVLGLPVCEKFKIDEKTNDIFIIEKI